MEKISTERKKRTRQNEDTEEDAKRDGSKESKRKKEEIKEEGTAEMDPIDFESLNKLSSFVGEGAQELLKQRFIVILLSCRLGKMPRAPLDNRLANPPPPGESTVPILGNQKQTPSKDIHQLCTMLVYLQNHLVSPPACAELFNVLPVPPPPPVIPSRLNIAVPPPPPPPPPPPSTSAAQAPLTPTLPQPSNSGKTRENRNVRQQAVHSLRFRIHLCLLVCSVRLQACHRQFFLHHRS
ncbi:hypothetical protein COOONC_07350 [Cooperia oncophora]